MSLRDRWPAVLTTGVLAFSSGITLYLLLSDKARRSEIRRRKTFLLTAEQEPEREELEMPLTPLERVRTRWGVLRVGGRFVNPFEEYVDGL
jgi:hypothetical protein